MVSIVFSRWYYDWGTIPKKDGLPYSTEKGAFRNHPCTQWAAKTHQNLAWLIRHGHALCNEYTRRYGKVHSCFDSLLIAEDIFLQNSNESLWIYNDVVEFTRAMPDEFKLDKRIDTFTAYKMYIASKPWVASNYLRMPERRPEWVI